MNLKGLKIAVLGGGISSEREVSLISANNAWEGLRAAGHNALFIDITTSREAELKDLLQDYKLDLVFIALHGEFGEDGGIQKILQDLGIAYTGSGVTASRLAMDKILSKMMFAAAGVSTPDFKVYSGDGVPSGPVGYPLVVKPSRCGSSLGVSIVRQASELPQALKVAQAYEAKVLLEEYIPGRELTVGILDDKPLTVVEIIPRAEYYDYSAKYDDGGSEFIAPADLPREVDKRCKHLAVLAHRALGLRHFSRVDLRLNPDNMPFVLEANSIPGLTRHSLLPLSAKACGISFQELLTTMVELAVCEKEAATKG